MDEQYTLLLIDDEEQFRFMTRLGLEANGFKVLEAVDGKEGMEILHSLKPDLVLLDLNMPKPDGHQVCEMIKNDDFLRHIPIIILTTSEELNDKLQRLDGGADDYITKSTDSKERAARIRAAIRRNIQNLDSNPLTHLPGNNKIQEILSQRMHTGEKFAVAYADLDNFKSFNDKYGFHKGDQVILFTADVIKQAVKDYGHRRGFVGHIGGDDFVIIADPNDMKSIGEEIIRRLNKGITDYYDQHDRKKGFIETKNRQGEIQKFPLVSISIAVVNNLHRSFTNIGEIIKIITELKKYAKQKTGSYFVTDKRK